jgi:hypothetical protein
METIDKTGLIAYGGTFEKKLILQLLLGLTATQDLTLDQNVKGKKNLTKLTTASIMRPYTSTFTATDSSLGYSGRSLQTEVGKGELLIDVMEYRNTWLEQQMQPGVPKADLNVIPFAADTWNQVMAKAATDLDLNTVWNGVHNPNGTAAVDICDGLNTILKAEILAGKLTANVTGAITKDNAVDQVEFMYKRHAAKYRGMEMLAYVSYDTYDKYCENHRERFGKNQDYTGFSAKPIAQSEGKCFLRPAIWMGNSGRIMVTPKANVMMATDRLSDLNQVRSVADVWTIRAGIALTLGFQFRDLEVLQVNDQA